MRAKNLLEEAQEAAGSEGTFVIVLKVTSLQRCGSKDSRLASDLAQPGCDQAATVTDAPFPDPRPNPEDGSLGSC